MNEDLTTCRRFQELTGGGERSGLPLFRCEGTKRAGTKGHLLTVNGEEKEKEFGFKSFPFVPALGLTVHSTHHP